MRGCQPVERQRRLEAGAADRAEPRTADRLAVQRAGEVIPQVVGPVLSRRRKGLRRFRMPAKCPV